MTVPFKLPEAEPPLTRPMRTYATRTRLLFLAFILILSALPLRAGTKIIHRWVLSDQTLPKLQKILVIGVLENYLIRQELEDEMERLLAKSGVQGIRSHMVLPPRNELMEGELKERIKEGDYDGVLIIRPKAMRKETKEVVTSLAGPLYVCLLRPTPISGRTGTWLGGMPTRRVPMLRKTLTSAQNSSSTTLRMKSSSGAEKPTLSIPRTSGNWQRNMPERSSSS